MLKISLLTIAVSLAFMCHGQTLTLEGVIYKMDSSKGLPYVTIGVKGTSRGTVTDSLGKFSIGVLTSDSLIISYVGLQSKIISVTEFKTPVYLEEEIIKLNEVVVHSKTRFYHAIFGNTKKSTHLLGGSNQYALLLRNEEKINGILEELFFYVQPDIDKSNLFETTVRIRVYKNENNLPGQDLLHENIITTLKKKDKKIVLDVSEYAIAMPPEGLFVGIDFLGYFDSKNIFIPYNRNKGPLNLRVQFSEGESFLTYSKFFGTNWMKVVSQDINGKPIKVSARFSAKVIY